MKKNLILLLMLMSASVIAQNVEKKKAAVNFTLLEVASFDASRASREGANKAQIKNVISTFMKCITKKDSIAYYNLFHNDPVVWVGVIKYKTYQSELKQNSKAKDYFTSSYRSFYKSLNELDAEEEKFYNVKIIEDGFIASVTFDYSFWKKGKKINWGKESWGMIKTQGQWKITGVIFSYEEESINAEPVRKNN